MHIEITPEVLLNQLNLGHGENTLQQIQNAIENTKDFDTFSKHIISLNDKLQHMNGYIALSNSEPYFKIKQDSVQSDEILQEFKEEIKHWSEKYNVELRKIENKDVYYIIGRK